METSALVDHFFRTEYGKAVSFLTAKFGGTHIELAEDSVQEALIKAMQTWPYSQIPENPTGWILRVASNKMIDQLRRNQKQVNDAIPEISEEITQEISSFSKTFRASLPPLHSLTSYPMSSISSRVKNKLSSDKGVEWSK